MTVLASVPDSPLDRLAREIAAEHAAAERAWESAVEHGHRAGQCLLEAKALCKHGGWLPWLRDVGIPARTAQVSIRLARKYADPAHLPSTITDALDALEDRDRRAYQERMRALSAISIGDSGARSPCAGPFGAALPRPDGREPRLGLEAGGGARPGIRRGYQGHADGPGKVEHRLGAPRGCRSTGAAAGR